ARAQRGIPSPSAGDSSPSSRLGMTGSQLPQRRLHAPQAFLQALHRRGVAYPYVLVAAERATRHNRYARLVEEIVGEALRVVDAVLSEVRLHLGEDVERGVRMRAAEAVDGGDGRNQPRPP